MINDGDLMKYAGWMLVASRTEHSCAITEPYNCEVTMTLQSPKGEKVDITIQSNVKEIEGQINER